MKLVFDGLPIAKKGHRLSKSFGRTVSYDPQHDQKTKAKWEAKVQMIKNRFNRVKNGPVGVMATFYMPMPKSWTKKRKEASSGKWHTSKPDLDNLLKFVSDVLNKIAYQDDSQIAFLLCEKIYSVNPRVEIEIYSLGDSMITEHALTVQKEITIQELEYMIKKAHRIGKQGRPLARVYSQYDKEGRHIYFEVGCLRESTVHKAG